MTLSNAYHLDEELKCIPARIILGIMCATGVMELYMSRTNLSIAIVAMVQIVTSENAYSENPREPYCLRGQNGTITTEFGNITDVINYADNSTLFNKNTQEDTRLKLTSMQRGNILSAFYYAYGTTAILGGYLAERIGTKLIFGAAVFVDAAGNFLIPIATKSNYIFLIVIRIVMGLFQGTCYPAMHCLTSKWIPQDELSRFISIVYVASTFGVIFTLNVSGVVISTIGWEYVFYISGAVSLVWLLFWIFLIYDNPSMHPRISEEEKNYILTSRASTKQKPGKTPWLKIFTYRPLWAIHIAHAGSVFGGVLILTQLPIYFSSIIGMNIKTNGFLSSLPFLMRYFGSISLSWISNYLIKKTKWTLRTWQRILIAIGHWCCGFCMLLVGYAGCNTNAILSLFSLSMILNGANFSGYLCNHLNIVPNYAGIAFGVSNTVGYFYSMLAPVIVGALTPEETKSEWIIVFWVTFINFFLSGAFYMVFVSTDVAPWNDPHPQNVKDEDKQQEINLITSLALENEKEGKENK